MAGNSLYSSLFSYVQTDSRSPLEDFLTQAFAHLLNLLLETHGALRQTAESFIRETLCGQMGDNVQLNSHLASARSLSFSPQVAIWLDGMQKRLDLCLDAYTASGPELLLVVENKVVQTRQGKADLRAGSGNTDKVAQQLSSYAKWLKLNHPKAGLVFLGVDDGPRDFPKDKGKYPAAFGSVCHWPQVWVWLRQLLQNNKLKAEAKCLLPDFIQFLENKELNDIDEVELKNLRRGLKYIAEFESELKPKIGKVMKQLKIFAKGTLPRYRGWDSGKPPVFGELVEPCRAWTPDGRLCLLL